MTSKNKCLKRQYTQQSYNAKLKLTQSGTFMFLLIFAIIYLATMNLVFNKKLKINI